MSFATPLYVATYVDNHDTDELLLEPGVIMLVDVSDQYWKNSKLEDAEAKIRREIRDISGARKDSEKATILHISPSVLILPKAEEKEAEELEAQNIKTSKGVVDA